MQRSINGSSKMGSKSTTKKSKKEMMREKHVAGVPDLDDFVIIVTGGYSGVGQAAVEIFLEKGATVVLACRNEEKAQQTVTELKSRYPDGDVNYLHFDASKKASIDGFIKEFTSKYEKLNILVNNAGVVKNPKGAGLTDFGTDVIYTVNMIAPYLLSIGLLDHLERGCVQNRFASRVVNVSSMAANRYKDLKYKNWNGQKESWAKRYCFSKLGLIMISNAFTRRCQAAGSSTWSLVCHPGFARSDLALEAAGSMFAKWGQDAFMGSLPTVMAATSASVGVGSYVTPKKVAWGPPVVRKEPKPALNVAKQDKLWEKLVEVTKQDIPFDPQA